MSTNTRTKIITALKNLTHRDNPNQTIIASVILDILDIVPAIHPVKPKDRFISVLKDCPNYDKFVDGTLDSVAFCENVLDEASRSEHLPNSVTLDSMSGTELEQYIYDLLHGGVR